MENSERSGTPDFDVLVIGGGSAGYAAARMAAEHGARTAVVEGGPIGGLCILEGCIPSKALLQSATLFHRLHTAGSLGLRFETGRLDFDRVMARKRALVAEFAADRKGELDRASGVTVLRGQARFAGRGEIAVRPLRGVPRGLEGDDREGLLADEERRYRARRVIVATGSTSSVPPIPGLEEAGFITSAQALDLETLPESLAVIGGGPIALELGQFYARAGSRVTILQREAHLLDGCDPEVVDALAGAFRAENIDVITEAKIGRCDRDGPERRVVQVSAGGEAREIVAHVLLVAVGRRARVEGLDLQAAGIELDKDECLVTVDETMRTSNPDVYAAGDAASARQMTHLAVLQGEVAGYNAAFDLGLTGPRARDPAARHTSDTSRTSGAGGARTSRNDGQRGRPFIPPASQRLGGVATAGPDGRFRMDYSVVPEVLYTDPAYARVGMSEREAREADIPYAVASYPFADLGMAIVMGETKGFVKMLARRGDGRLLGVEILGHQADTLIHEAVLAMAFGATVADLARVPRYHPTLSEVLTYPAEELAAQIDP